MDRIEELEVWLAIVDAGSLAAAARLLNRSPPAITRILACLEARTGGRLLVRSSRRLELTPRGRALVGDARNLIELYGAATGAPRTEQSAFRLRLTAPVQFGRRHVVPTITDLMAQDPRLQIELQLQDRVLDLTDERIDIAVRIGAPRGADEVHRIVGDVRYVVVGSPGYLAIRGMPAEPRDLQDHELLIGLRGGYATEWRFSEAGRRALPRGMSRLAVDDVETRLRFALDGHGLGQFLSYQVFDELEDGRLARVLAHFEAPPVPVIVVERGARREHPKFRRVFETLVKDLSRNPVLSN